MAGRSSTAEASDVLDYLWLLESSASGDMDGITLKGGALCVDPRGILVTVKLGISVRAAEFPKYPIVQATNYQNVVRNTKWITNVDSELSGIAILKLVKIDENEKFKCLPIPNEVSVYMCTKVFAYVYDGYSPFSLQNGRVNYQFHGNLKVPANQFAPFTLTHETHLETRTPRNVTKVLTDESISTSREIVNMLRKGVKSEYEFWNPSIPLIQVNGFRNTTMDGQCGWPVFSEKRNKLLGLIFTSANVHQYVIPAQILREVVKRNANLF